MNGRVIINPNSILPLLIQPPFTRFFFVIRHTEKYNYNNIWINLYSQPPGDTLHKAPYELQLATNEKGWLGTGMDDIYEQRSGV
jgi:gliding motility-associated lipoprotein GldH